MKRAPMPCQLGDEKGNFTPHTRHGLTRYEMTASGPMRPGKTRQDFMPVQERQRFRDWQRRLMRAQGAADMEQAA